MAKHRLTSTPQPLEREPAHPLSDGSTHPYAEHLSRHPLVGLGYNAVLGALDSALAELGSDSPVRQRALHRLAEKAAHDEHETQTNDGDIDYLRRQISRLSPDSAEYYANKIADESPYLRMHLLGEIPVRDKDSGKVTWKDEMVGEINEEIRGVRLIRSMIDVNYDTNHEMHYDVPDTVVQSFAEWLAHDTQRRQAELDTRAESMKQAYIDQVHKRAKSQRLPEGALKRLTQLEAVDILVDDGFTTKNKHGQASLGWHQHEDYRPVVVLSPALTNVTVGHVANHEQTHAISSPIEVSQSRYEVLEPLFGPVGATVMNEALTEHFNARLYRGNFDDIHPATGDDLYADFRTLLDTMANHGLVKIDIREFYDALYFSELEEGKSLSGDERVEKLTDKLNEAFPYVNIFHEMKEEWSKPQPDNQKKDINELARELTAKLKDSTAHEKHMRQVMASSTKLQKGLARANLVLTDVVYSNDRLSGRNKAKKK